MKNRTQGIDKWFKIQAEVPLRMKQFLDAKKKAESSVNYSREEVLENGEKALERQEAEEKAKLKAERAKAFEAYETDVSFMPLAEMSEEQFQGQLNMAKIAYEAKIEADKKAEEDRLEAERLAEANRLAKEKDEEAERKRIDDENAKLKAESEAREKELAKAKVLRDKRSTEIQPYIMFIRDYNSLIESSESEYQNQYAEIKKGAEEYWAFEVEQKEKQKQKDEAEKAERDRLAKEASDAKAKADKLEAEAKAKADEEARIKREAEAKAKADEEAKANTEREKELAPDKDKINALYASIKSIQYPECSSEESKKIVSDTNNLINKVLNHIKESAKSLKK